LLIFDAPILRVVYNLLEGDGLWREYDRNLKAGAWQAAIGECQVNP